MRKYRLMEEKIKKDLDEVKRDVEKLDQETKRVLGINEETLDLIRNCSFEQLQEMNKNR
jgi:hypothetical protein